MAYDISLKMLHQKVIRKRELKNDLTVLYAQLEELSGRLASLEEALESIRKRVEKLEKGGIYAFFHTITGKKEEKLEQERQQVDDLAKQYEEAGLAHQTIKRRIELKETELATLDGYEEKFENLLEVKRREIEQLQVPEETKIIEVEQEIAICKEHAALFVETIKQSDMLLEQIQRIREILNDAEKAAISQSSAGFTMEARKAELIKQAQAQVGVLKAGIQDFSNKTEKLLGSTSIKINLNEVYEICNGIYTSYIASNMVLNVAEIERIRTTKGNLMLLKERLENVIPQLLTEQEGNKKKRDLLQEKLENLIIEG